MRAVINKIAMMAGVLAIVLIANIPAFAEEDSTYVIMSAMQRDLNLSDDQVTNISQVVDRYVMACKDLQKSIDDNTINPSAVKSQQQQLKATEDQAIAQFLNPDQLNQWRMIQNQEDASKRNEGVDDADSDIYSNFPRNLPSSE